MLIVCHREQAQTSPALQRVLGYPATISTPSRQGKIIPIRNDWGGGGPKEIFQDFGLNWDKTKYLNSLHEQKLRKDLIQRVSIFPCRLSSTLLNNDAQQT